MIGHKAKLGLILTVALSAPSSLAAQEGAQSNWAYREQVDPVSDAATASAFIVSEDGRGRLNISCNGIYGPTLSLQYITSSYLGVVPHMVAVRIGEGAPAESYSWEYTSKGAYITKPEFLALFASLISTGKDRIFVRALNYELQPVDAVFQSIDAKSAMDRVQAVCDRAAK